MDKLEQLIAEVESRIRGLEACFNGKFPMSQSVKETEQDKGKLIAYKSVLSFIDSMIVDECIYGKEPEMVDVDELPKEEPSEIDFEQELYKAFGQVKDFTLGMRIAKWFYDMGKNSQEPVSEDLEEAAYKFVMDNFGNPKEPLYKFEQRCFKAGAKWQKQQDQSTIELAEDHAMLAGMEKMKEEMMKAAIEGKVTDARSYESYKIDEIDITVDYDKDTTPFVVDDMVKLIIIKED